jgi:hypothetical protein
MADGDEFTTTRDIDLRHGDRNAEHDRLEGKVEVLFDCRVESDCLFGVGVCVDDDLLDHCVESTSRNSGASGRAPDVASLLTSFGHTGAAPRRPLCRLLNRGRSRVYFKVGAAPGREWPSRNSVNQCAYVIEGAL